MVKAAFYYGYPLTQLIGGYLAQRFGTRWVFGIQNALAAVLTILTPFASQAHVWVVIVLRFLMGLIEGMMRTNLIYIIWISLCKIAFRPEKFEKFHSISCINTFQDKMLKCIFSLGWFRISKLIFSHSLGQNLNVLENDVWKNVIIFGFWPLQCHASKF